MKYKLSFYIILFITLLNYRCSLFLGIRSPKQLNENEIKLYLWKNIKDTSYCFYLRKDAFDSLTKVSYKPNWSTGFRPLQFKVFDSNNKLICQYSSCEGSLRKLKILSTYPPKNFFPLDTTIKFYDDLKLYCDSKFSKIDINQFKNTDLNIVVYWAKWMGLPGKNLLKKLKKYQQKHQQYKINLIKINILENNYTLKP